jgi:hypothetical protein
LDTIGGWQLDSASAWPGSLPGGNLVLAGPLAVEDLFEAPAGEAYLGLVPAGAVLVLQGLQITAVVHPPRLPRVVEQHEGEQPLGFRFFGQQFL